MNTSLRLRLFLPLLLPATVWSGPVNINTADAAALRHELKGIGPAKAAAIVDYRQKHGPFKSADELAQVKGIGQKFIDSHRADIRVGGAATPSPSMVIKTPKPVK